MTLAPELTVWSFDPSVVGGLILLAAVYGRGFARAMATRRPLEVVGSNRSGPTRPWQAIAFYAGLCIIILALESPIDNLSATLFSFHMLQHVLLIMVAAPLLLLGNPAVTLTHGVPLGLRRSVLGTVAHRQWAHVLARTLGSIRRPVPTAIIFTIDLYLWHWNRLYNLTLQNDTVHLFEHLCFLATTLLFWSQLIDQRAVHMHLSYLQRAIYTLVTAATSNVLAMYFVFTLKPLYSAYANLPHRTFGATPLADQQIAGAIMWIPVLFLFGGAFLICLYKALAEDERESSSTPYPVTPYSMSVTGSTPHQY